MRERIRIEISSAAYEEIGEALEAVGLDRFMFFYDDASPSKAVGTRLNTDNVDLVFRDNSKRPKRIKSSDDV